MQYTIVQNMTFRLPSNVHFIQDERFYPGEIRQPIPDKIRPQPFHRKPAVELKI